jgi:hypothetical protein
MSIPTWDASPTNKIQTQSEISKPNNNKCVEEEEEEDEYAEVRQVLIICYLLLY